MDNTDNGGILIEDLEELGICSYINDYPGEILKHNKTEIGKVIRNYKTNDGLKIIRIYREHYSPEREHCTFIFEPSDRSQIHIRFIYEQSIRIAFEGEIRSYTDLQTMVISKRTQDHIRAFRFVVLLPKVPFINYLPYISIKVMEKLGVNTELLEIGETDTEYVII